MDRERTPSITPESAHGRKRKLVRSLANVVIAGGCRAEPGVDMARRRAVALGAVRTRQL